MEQSHLYFLSALEIERLNQFTSKYRSMTDSLMGGETIGVPGDALPSLLETFTGDAVDSIAFGLLNDAVKLEQVCEFPFFMC